MAFRVRIQYYFPNDTQKSTNGGECSPHGWHEKKEDNANTQGDQTNNHKKPYKKSSFLCLPMAFFGNTQENWFEVSLRHHNTNCIEQILLLLRLEPLYL